MPTWWEAWGSLHKTASEELKSCWPLRTLGSVPSPSRICDDYRPASKLTAAEDSPLRLRTQGHHARLWCWHWGNRRVFLRPLRFMVLCYSARMANPVVYLLCLSFCFFSQKLLIIPPYQPNPLPNSSVVFGWCRHWSRAWRTAYLWRGRKILLWLSSLHPPEQPLCPQSSQPTAASPHNRETNRGSLMAALPILRRDRRCRRWTKPRASPPLKVTEEHQIPHHFLGHMHRNAQGAFRDTSQVLWSLCPPEYIPTATLPFRISEGLSTATLVTVLSG